MARGFHVRIGRAIVADLDDPVDAAAIVAARLSGEVLFGSGRRKRVVWREGDESFSAGESFDGAAATMLERALEGIRRGAE